MTSKRFEIAGDISRAETLPANVYVAPNWYERAKERIFARSWQFIGEAAQVRSPGHVRPFTLLEGCLDEPLLLSVDEKMGVHCLSNVCTHRGALVVEGEGHLKNMRCRYHGRRFALDGSFLSMPEFEGVADFPGAKDNLPGIALEPWGPFLFCNLNPAFAFAELVAPMNERIDFLPLDSAVFDPSTSRDYFINANWALYCDNYLEEFHLPYVHNASLAGLDYGEYRTELFPYGTLQLGAAKSKEDSFALPGKHPESGRNIAAFYYWLFPNLMFNFYPWGLSVNVVCPLGPERTKVSFLSFVWDETRRRRGVGADLHRVEMEDEEVVESVQRGVRSRLYDRGRYSPRRETGTHHFHRLLARFLNE
jgi:phenylpropionate dioxygenase-like ring-hydroxylating dioxygenase large terminal subunit